MSRATSPAPLPPGSVIGIIGDGQLGRMLSLAAARLGLRTAVLGGAGSPAASGGVRTSKPSACAAPCGNSVTVSSSPSASTTARNRAFSNWRTLPGQG